MTPKIDNFSPKKTSSHSNLPIYTQFIQELENEYPNFIFKPSNRFRFHPPKTIYYEMPLPNSHNLSPYFLQLLHELGHAVSHHYNYSLSVDRLKIETEAWVSAHHIFKSHSNWPKNTLLILTKISPKLNLTLIVIGYIKKPPVKSAD